ncbi:MAG TPA: response regulator transcription factor [Anaerolineaceae bacterium]|nr:response regulator transcription factor [Anaerolineaceae bacterium]
MNKVMLVDDDAMMLNLLQTLLELEGFEVYPVDSAGCQSLLEKVNSVKPDAILLDIHLRSCSGMDLLRELRTNHPLNDVRILMTSGEDLRESCLAAGADGFLLKPYMPEELIQHLRASGS